MGSLVRDRVLLCWALSLRLHGLSQAVGLYLAYPASLCAVLQFDY